MHDLELRRMGLISYAIVWSAYPSFFPARVFVK